MKYRVIDKNANLTKKLPKTNLSIKKLDILLSSKKLIPIILYPSKYCITPSADKIMRR